MLVIVDLFLKGKYGDCTRRIRMAVFIVIEKDCISTGVGIQVKVSTKTKRDRNM
jgi:hypothetical protein